MMGQKEPVLACLPTPKCGLLLLLLLTQDACCACHPCDHSPSINRFYPSIIIPCIPCIGHHHHQMIRVVNIKQEDVATLQAVTDFSYAWDIINDFLAAMQERVRLTPHTVLTLRSTFLKLGSVGTQRCIAVRSAHCSAVRGMARLGRAQAPSWPRLPLSPYRSLCLSASLPLHLSLCISVSLSLCLSLCLALSLALASCVAAAAA
eukprot:SAG22_NODE_1947_length_3277_cov_1.880743_6_plen_205_part_00